MKNKLKTFVYKNENHGDMVATAIKKCIPFSIVSFVNKIDCLHSNHLMIKMTITMMMNLQCTMEKERGGNDDIQTSTHIWPNEQKHLFANKIIESIRFSSVQFSSVEFNSIVWCKQTLFDKQIQFVFASLFFLYKFHKRIEWLQSNFQVQNGIGKWFYQSIVSNFCSNIIQTGFNDTH